MAMSAPSGDVFHAIAHPIRRKLLGLLAGQEMPIAALLKHLPVSRTAVVKHLHVLENAGLASSTRSGRETLFKLQPKPLTEVQAWLAEFEPFWEEKLQALKRYVESDHDQ